MKRLLFAATALAAAGALAPSAGHAATILSFAQAGGGNPITATDAAGVTTISTGLGAAITVTGILTGPAVPFAATLNLSAHSTTADSIVGGILSQHFSGSFSIVSALCGAGNCLSGTFVDIVAGTNGGSSATLSATTPPPGSVTFTSDVISASNLGLDRALGIGFANILPGFRDLNGDASIDSFTSSVGGTFSANPVAEPASLALLGVGILGLAGVARRRAT